MLARFIRAWVVPDTVKKQLPIQRRTHVGTGVRKKGQDEKAAGSDPKKKVYCENCHWLGKATSGYFCNHESNRIYKKTKQTWLTPRTEYTNKKHPRQKNKRNDCEHFAISYV